MNEEYDDEINLKDLFLNILLKWKTWVILMIIGAVCGAGVSLLVPKKSDDDLSSIKDSDLKTAETAYSVYKNALDEKDAYEKQMNSSAIRKIESPTALQNSYVVTSDVSNVEKVIGQAAVFSDEQAQDIISFCEFPDDTTDLESLVQVSFSNEEQSSDNLNASSSTLQSTLKVTNGGNNNVFTITTFGNSEDQCTHIMDLVRTNIDKQASVLQSNNIAFTYTETDSMITNGSQMVQDVLSEQRSKLSKLQNNVLTTEQPTTLSANAQTVLTTLIQNDGEVPQGSVVHRSMKKCVVLGLFAGLVLGVIIIVFQYAADGTMRDDSLFTYMGIRNFGIVDTTDKKELGFFSRKVYSSYYDAVSLDTAEQMIQNVAEKENVHHLCILTDDGKTGEKLAEKLKSNGTVSVHPLLSERLSDDFYNADGILLTTVYGETKTESIQKIVSMCRTSEKPIFGAFLLRKYR